MKYRVSSDLSRAMERDGGVLFLPKLLEKGKVEREKKEVQETGA